jgi:hypothetical protein
MCGSVQHMFDRPHMFLTCKYTFKKNWTELLSCVQVNAEMCDTKSIKPCSLSNL